nr:MAG TPA: hypothetical protein [Caudoviricetes sp.]
MDNRYFADCYDAEDLEVLSRKVQATTDREKFAEAARRVVDNVLDFFACFMCLFGTVVFFYLVYCFLSGSPIL